MSLMISLGRGTWVFRHSPWVLEKFLARPALTQCIPLRKSTLSRTCTMTSPIWDPSIDPSTPNGPRVAPQAAFRYKLSKIWTSLLSTKKKAIAHMQNSSKVTRRWDLIRWTCTLILLPQEIETEKTLSATSTGSNNSLRISQLKWRLTNSLIRDSTSKLLSSVRRQWETWIEPITWSLLFWGNHLIRMIWG